MQYYYLLASLPALQLGKDPKLDSTTFNELCRVHLQGEQYQELSTVAHAYGLGEGFKEYTTGKFARQCIDYYRSLFATLAEYRMLPHGYERGHLHRDIALRANISQAFADAATISQEANSYHAEVLIMKLIWRFVEQLEFPYFFRFENVLAYCVKLWATQRYNLMTKEKGEERCVASVETIMDTYHKQI